MIGFELDVSSTRESKKSSPGGQIDGSFDGDKQLNEQEVFGRLHFDEISLFGRGIEVERLRNAFNRMCEGESSAQIVVVASSPGSGKTRLVETLRQYSLDHAGLFVSASFDQLHQGDNFFDLLAAFDDLCELVLQTEHPQTNLLAGSMWRELEETLNTKEQVLLSSAIPSFYRVFGKLPDTGCDPASIKKRGGELQRPVYAMLRTIARRNPVVLFLDDIMKADHATRVFIQHLLSEEDLRQVLVICTHSHQIQLMSDLEAVTEDEFLELLESTSPAFEKTTINLPNLDEKATNCLVASALKMTPSETIELGKLIHRRTMGNPLYAERFLELLGDEKYVQFSSERACWVWDLKMMKEKTVVAPNVLLVLQHRLAELDEPVSELLKLASAVGLFFDGQILYEIVRAEIDKVQSVLASSMKLAPSNADVLFGDRYRKWMGSCIKSGFFERGDEKNRYRFSHDQIRRDLYDRLKRDGKYDNIHQKVGQIARQTLESLESGDKNVDFMTFLAADQMNKAASQSYQHDEISDLARLNLQAGRLSASMGNSKAAVDYIRKACLFLDAETVWYTDYIFAIEVYSTLAEFEMISGETSQAKEMCHMVSWKWLTKKGNLASVLIPRLTICRPCADHQEISCF